LVLKVEMPSHIVQPWACAKRDKIMIGTDYDGDDNQESHPSCNTFANLAVLAYFADGECGDVQEIASMAGCCKAAPTKNPTKIPTKKPTMKPTMSPTVMPVSPTLMPVGMKRSNTMGMMGMTAAAPKKMM
jgi:hypothetical protein